jgi:hypothetical protein
LFSQGASAHWISERHQAARREDRRILSARDGVMNAQGRQHELSSNKHRVRKSRPVGLQQMLQTEMMQTKIAVFSDVSLDCTRRENLRGQFPCEVYVRS